LAVRVDTAVENELKGVSFVNSKSSAEGGDIEGDIVFSALTVLIPFRFDCSSMRYWGDRADGGDNEFEGATALVATLLEGGIESGGIPPVVPRMVLRGEHKSALRSLRRL